MAARVTLEKIVLRSGDILDLADGVTAVVGPNNSGKSSLLREVRDGLSAELYDQGATPRRIVESLGLTFQGSGSDFFDDLAVKYRIRVPGTYNNYGTVSEPHVVMDGHMFLTESDIESHWDSHGGLGARFAYYFVRFLNAEERLGLTASVGSYDLHNDLPSVPLQMLLADREKEKVVSDLCQVAFGNGLVVNRYAGGMIHLHTGLVCAEETISPPPPAYTTELNALPLMNQQGDGMRAFVGMTLSIITNQTPLILIDEPEAFLHPPQARMFGKFLARFAAEGGGAQILVATHSQDLIAGLTGDQQSNQHVSIARLTRDGNTNHVNQLDAALISRLYSDPLLKHQNMLNGLFTTGVVLCEGDSDCTYYRAVVDSRQDGRYRSIQDSHFTHVGGKARIATAIAAFRGAGVPVCAVFDIDILQNQNEFFGVVDAVGADRGCVQSKRNTVVAAVGKERSCPKRADARSKIKRILKDGDGQYLTNAEIDSIRKIVTPKSGWKEFKTSGLRQLSGGAHAAFTELTEYLERFGVFMVEQGELERFHPEVPQTRKSSWLQTVLEKQLYEDSPATEMLGRVSAFIEGSTSGSHEGLAAANV